MKRKIYGYFCLLALGTAILTGALISFLMHNRFYSAMRQSTADEVNLIKSVLDADSEIALDQLMRNPDSFRITLFSPEGTVLLDNARRSDIQPVDAGLPEVEQAFSSGTGERVYFSDKKRAQTFSYAARLNDGSVVRAAKTTDSLFWIGLKNIPYLVQLMLIVFLLTISLAKKLTSKIIDPINNLNLDEIPQNAVDDAFSPLISRITNQRKRLDRQMTEARARQIEFDSISKNMREGLIVLNASANIISINRSALNYFVAKPADYVGKPIYLINRGVGLQTAIEKALKGQPNEDMIFVANRSLQLLASPILDNNVVRGIILLVMDVTEKQEAETRRREFSANVSHELKTPLTAISGYAELLKNGLVKAADVPQFSERIYSEATRMSALISDIITLSRLDEKQVELPFEYIDLYQILSDISQNFADSAQARGINITLTGKPAVIYGIRRILDEMFFNICDNALKYNRDGGRIDISISESIHFIEVAVADSGIGIPEEDHDRVFERFYRVDKSHSRQTGGTGLGLSIVKHGASIHKAQIVLKSTPNVGTTIGIRFPKA